MIIYEDCRNKLGKHMTKNNYWKRKGIIVDRSHKLFVGDYMLDVNGKISIDTKQNIMELATDFFCDKTRFEKECIKAKTNGILLIFLIEEKIDNKEQLLKWKSPSNINGKCFLNVRGWQIYKEMQRYGTLFGCKFRFCHKNSTGKVILELLEKYNNKF